MHTIKIALVVYEFIREKRQHVPLNPSVRGVVDRPGSGIFVWWPEKINTHTKIQIAEKWTFASPQLKYTHTDTPTHAHASTHSSGEKTKLYCLYLGSLIIHSVTHALLSFDNKKATKNAEEKNFMSTNTPDRGSVVVAKSALVELLVVAVDCDAEGDFTVDMS